MKVATTASKSAILQYLESRQLFVEHFLGYPARGVDQDFLYEFPNLQQALALGIELEMKSDISVFWNGIKDFLMDNGFWIIFAEWGEAILSGIKSLNNSETGAWLLSDIGWLSMERGDFFASRERFERALNMFFEMKHEFGICALERYMGVLAYRMGDLERASNQFEKAAKLAAAQNLYRMIGEIKNLQGSLARKRGDASEARRLYQESRLAFKNPNDAWYLTAVLRNLAWLEYQEGNYMESKRIFSETIELCKQLGRKDMLYGCYLRLAEVESKLGNISDAMVLAANARNGFIELGLTQNVVKADEFLVRLSGVANSDNK